MKNKNKKYFVSIVGNIGVGKTTFAELISQKYKWKIFYEKVIDNPYLPDYYENMKKWSFHLQIYFFNHRFKEQLEIINNNVSCVQDRSIYEDPEIFAYVLHEQNNLNDRDYQTYLQLYKNLIPFLPDPNLFIYLKASTWTLLSRIRKRGRDFEMGITGEFLHQLNLAYERWMKKLTETHNVLIIDTDKLDIQKDENKLEDLFNQINLKLNKT
jgi:deoxyadenosine/deoxycytidine kinase